MVLCSAQFLQNGRVIPVCIQGRIPFRKQNVPAWCISSGRIDTVAVPSGTAAALDTQVEIAGKQGFSHKSTQR